MMNLIPNDPNASFGGTGFKAYLATPWSFEETIARLLGAGFERLDVDGDGKVSIEFIGSFGGQTFTLYDYKGDRALHIGWDGLDVDGLNAALVALLMTATPVPYTATERYDECDGLTHGWRPQS